MNDDDDDTPTPGISPWPIASGTLFVMAVGTVMWSTRVLEHRSHVCRYCAERSAGYGYAAKVAGILMIAAVACAIVTYIMAARHQLLLRIIADVVILFGVFSVVALPNFLEAHRKSSMCSCIANMRNIDAAVSQYVIEENPSATNIVLENLVPKYLKQVPICHPSHRKYIITNVHSEFTVACPAAGTYPDHVL